MYDDFFTISLNGMKTPDAPLQELASQVEELRRILADNGSQFWVDALSVDLIRLHAGDRMGCASFLSHFGGNSSLNDISMGDAATDAKFEALSSSAKVLARAQYPSIWLQSGPISRRVLYVGVFGMCLVLLLALLR